MIETIHIAVCMKPVEGTLAENALQHGVAGLNVGECKIAFVSSADERNTKDKNQHTHYSNPNSNIDSYSGSMPSRTDYDAPGRFPANVILDGSEEVVGVFPGGAGGGHWHSNRGENRVYSGRTSGGSSKDVNDGVGSAARFFHNFQDHPQETK